MPQKQRQFLALILVATCLFVDSPARADEGDSPKPAPTAQKPAQSESAQAGQKSTSAKEAKAEGEVHPVLAKVELITKLRKAKRYDEALATVTQARALDMDASIRAQLEFVTGQVYFSKGQAALLSGTDDDGAQASMEQAIRTLAMIVEKHPADDDAGGAAYLLGSSYFMLDRLPESIAAYKKAHDDFPESHLRAKSLLRMGVCKAAQGKQAEATALYRRVVKEFPDAKADAKKARKYLSEAQLVDRRAPPLGVSDWLYGSVGSEGLASFQGQVVVVVFFATWCNHCSHNMPRLQQTIESWEAEGVVFLGVANPNDPQNTEPVDSYVDKNNIRFQDVALDRKYATWQRYRVTGLPACVIVDREGILRWRGNLSFLPQTMIRRLASQ